MQDVAQHGMPGSLQRAQPAFQAGIIFLLGMQINKDAVVAIDIWWSQRLGADRNDAASLFAGAFGNKLLDPESDGIDGRCRNDGELIAPSFGENAESSAKPRAGIFRRADHIGAGMHGVVRPVEQFVEVAPHQGEWHHSEK